MTDTGASIQQNQDPRVTKLIGVGITILAASIIGIGAWIGSTLVGIKESLASITTQNIAFARSIERNDNRDDGQDTRLGKIERDQAMIEGRVMRGIQNYGKETRGQ